MAIEIFTESDQIKVNNLFILIYGDPGVGKTSLANTSANPITFDFDNGAHRSVFRKKIARVKAWSDLSVLPEIVKGHDTIVIDTAGTAMDYLIAELPNKEGNSPANKRSDGTLTVAGYGTLKNRFTAWCQTLRALGKDIVFIAHAKEKGNSDEKVIRPDIVGGSYDMIVRQCDFVGYFAAGNSQSSHGVLNFSPRSEHIGKNSANFPELIIPDFSENPNYFADKISEMKDAINKLSESQKEAQVWLNGIREDLSKAKTPEDFNSARKTINAYPNEGLKIQAKTLMKNALPANILFSKEKDCFYENISDLA